MAPPALAGAAFAGQALPSPVMLAPAALSASPQHAEPVVRQVVEAVLRIQGDQTEIALSPEELGSIRLVVKSGETVPMVTVWVDRADVLEMLRRNADQLAADLRGSGMADAQLDFRDGSDWRGPQGGGAGPEDTAPREEVIAIGGADGAARQAQRQRQGQAIGRLDIRV